jgi:hypothetical protein
MYEKVSLNLTFFSSGTLFGIRIRDDYGPVRVYSAFSNFLFTFKGTVSRDFLLLVFLMNQFPPQPQSIPIGPFKFFFESQGAPLVSTTRWQICHRYQRHRRLIFPPVSLVLLIPVVNLPPVSTIPAANLPPV